jgi:enamine deaminase RidA (YjgF/YER057c/UK114 family)
MGRRLISMGSPFERAYGYSRAVVAEPFVFVSGTTGYDYGAMTLPDSAADQARACWRTIAAVLGEAGSSLEEITRATYYVTDRADAEAVLAVCGEILAEIRPAATLLVVAGLLKAEMKVEIEVTALRAAT